MKYLLIVASVFAAVLLFLLAVASSNTALFARQYPILLVLNGIIALALAGLLGWQVRQLWREYRRKQFGSRLKLRLMLMFGALAVIPGLVVYGISVQFLTRSIETWFDVRVERALESGLTLGRGALDSLLADLHDKARGMALELGDVGELRRSGALPRLREQTGGHTAALFTERGQLLASASADAGGPRPRSPDSLQLAQARVGKGLSVIDSDPGGELLLRVLVPVVGRGLAESVQILQLTQPVPEALAENADTVQSVYRDYQELALARDGLTRLYALTLTLAVLLALFAAFALAFVFARRLSAPLSILAAGTEAVAQGDFTPREAMHGRDELGVLTRSFAQMTRQLDDARRETERHRADVEAARAYLESILAHLSAGVLVFDRRFVLRLANAGGKLILHDELTGMIGEPVEAWPRQALLGKAIRDGFAEHVDSEWQLQLERPGDNGMPQFLLLRGSPLPDGGYVVVFDDVTRLVAAQRSAAWGEVARRLAHEIKNPLTPIQLSAERLQMKLTPRLDEADAAVLSKSVTTIVSQVQAMKRMVDAFREYGRQPSPELGPVDLGALVRQVLGLYETSAARIAQTLPADPVWIAGDPTQLRQLIHNLLRNAEDALGEVTAPRIEVRIDLVGPYLQLTVSDNGPGFPADILARAFEPYVTTKVRGTGLGLAMVKKIVDEHQGRVALGNADPQGAVVTVEWPRLVRE